MSNENQKDEFMQAAIDEAHLGRSQGGIPIGSVLIRDGKIVGRGHNKRVQEDSAIKHGEMDCLTNAGRQRTYRDTVIYTTLMPCYMCAGTIVQFKIPFFNCYNRRPPKALVIRVTFKASPTCRFFLSGRRRR